MLSILIVDDSLFQMKNILKILSEREYSILKAKNGEEGLNHFQNEKIDCIISDLLMPVLDGFGMIKKIREIDQNIPIIVITADIQETSQERVKELGVTKMLNKPPKKDELLSALDEILI